MIRVFPLIEKPHSLCEGCIFGKQHRESFPSRKSIRAKAPLEIVHSDLCGTMKTPSLASSHYMLTFIDDFTRKTWVYFLKNKSEVFEKFCNFKALVENQSGLHIKFLRMIEEVSISLNILYVFVEKMAFISNLQLGTLHIKMELPKGRIEQSWI